MEKKCDEERWALFNSTENSVEAPEDGGGGGGEEEEDEALSLCDLPLIHQSSRENEEDNTPLRAIETQEDFDFCSLSKESEMCAADEVFYQGQILPLRHSMSSKNGVLQHCDSRNFSRSISRSESMDHCSSGGLISSRSSSISSHQSSSSGSSSTATTDPKCKLKLPPRNQFHSHPSPSPKISFPTNRQGIVRINNRNCAKKSSAWNIFRLGLVSPPPEIAFQDLKTRCPINTNSRNLGSRNSNSSQSTSLSSGSDKKKIKPIDFLGGCKCKRSVDAVDTVPSKVVVIKRSASEVGALRVEEEENLLGMKSPKKRLSHYRTFEWLKQLSLEATTDEP
ncbi:hypothetical protein Pfo_019372 [Paulownia fortunei]|nr:hypothetical protein Pfo_019372 [Paulownia fortunei]